MSDTEKLIDTQTKREWRAGTRAEELDIAVNINKNVYKDVEIQRYEIQR